MQHNNQKSKFHIIPKSPGLISTLLLFLVIEIVFLSLLIALDILPTILNVVIVIVFIGLTVLIFKLLANRKEVTKQRKIGVILSFVLMVLMGIGSFYLFTTYAAFSHMSDADNQYEEFYVVASRHGSYKKVDDIKGKTVYTYQSTSMAYDSAKEKLQKKVKVKYEDAGGYMNLKGKLLDDENKEHDEIIFLSSSNYEMICDYAENFKKKTRIIYKVSVDINNKDIAKRVGITSEPFNVYISGIDTYGGIKKVSRSDVNMIMTVNPKEKKILLTSIPRDMYVTLHSSGQLDKLTHSGIYGIDETVSTVEDWLGTDINYYIRVNFTSLQDIVDAIGGVDVESPKVFKSAVSKYTYTEGMNHLNGEAALFFARERKAFADGDNERVKNQQRVVKAIVDKISGSSVILLKYTQLMNTVGQEVQTNLTEKDISSLVKMQLNDLGGWDIESISIMGKGTYAPTYSMGSQKLYVAIPYEESVAEAQEAIRQVMNK